MREEDGWNKFSYFVANQSAAIAGSTLLQETSIPLLSKSCMAWKSAELDIPIVKLAPTIQFTTDPRLYTISNFWRFCIREADGNPSACKKWLVLVILYAYNAYNAYSIVYLIVHKHFAWSKIPIRNPDQNSCSEILFGNML